MFTTLRTNIFFPALLVFIALGSMTLLGVEDYRLIEKSSSLGSLQRTDKSDEQLAEKSTSDIPETNKADMLFGVPIINEVTGLERLPETQVALELKGTFANSTDHMASALIAKTGSDAQRYFLGEQINDNIELVRVEKELVVIRRNNQDEILRLARFGDIQIGPELNYRSRSNANSEDLLSQLPEYSAGNSTYVAADATTSAVAQPQVQPRLTAQERLARLRARYSKPNN